MKIPTQWNNEQQCSVCCTSSSSRTSAKQHQKPKRGVSFTPDNQVYEIPSRQTYSPEERSASFYAPSDYKNFKKASLVTLKLNRTLTSQSNGPQQLLPPSQHTMRGLECRTREGAQERKEARLNAAFVVFQEQERQRLQTGVVNAELIAEKYHDKSQSSQLSALLQGMCDELEAGCDYSAGKMQEKKTLPEQQDHRTLWLQAMANSTKLSSSSSSMPIQGGTSPAA